MRSTTWLAGLMLAVTSMTAAAATPSYDYIQLDYVGVNRHDSSFDFQGADFQLSALIAPYLLFDASYQWLDSDRFTVGPLTGRVEQQTITAGLEGRLPLVRNQLDGFLGADFVYQDAKYREDFKGVAGFDDQYSTGFQIKGGVRANFNYFELVPSVRYIRIFDQDDLAFGIQLLGCPGYGICLTAGGDYQKDSKDTRYFAGLRFNYD